MFSAKNCAGFYEVLLALIFKCFLLQLQFWLQKMQILKRMLFHRVGNEVLLTTPSSLCWHSCSSLTMRIRREGARAIKANSNRPAPLLLQLCTNNSNPRPGLPSAPGTVRPEVASNLNHKSHSFSPRPGPSGMRKGAFNSQELLSKNNHIIRSVFLWMINGVNEHKLNGNHKFKRKKNLN